MIETRWDLYNILWLPFVMCYLILLILSRWLIWLRDVYDTWPGLKANFSPTSNFPPGKILSLQDWMDGEKNIYSRDKITKCLVGCYHLWPINLAPRTALQMTLDLTTQIVCYQPTKIPAMHDLPLSEAGRKSDKLYCACATNKHLYAFQGGTGTWWGVKFLMFIDQYSPNCLSRLKSCTFTMIKLLYVGTFVGNSNDSKE